MAFLLLMLQMLTLATAWWYALALMGAPLPWSTGTSMWLRAQLARYLPGGMWDIAGRLVISRGLDMPARAIPAAAGLEIGLQLVSAMFVVILTLIVFPLPAATWSYLALAGIAFSLLVAGLVPPVFERIIAFGLRLLGRPPLPIRMTLAHQGILLGLYVTAHALQGLAFVLFVRGITILAWNKAPLLAGAYVAAWLAGYVAVFAPTGIGVREAVLLLLTEYSLPASIIVGAAFGFRVWLTFRDFLAAVGGTFLWAKRGVHHYASND